MRFAHPAARMATGRFGSGRFLWPACSPASRPQEVFTLAEGVTPDKGKPLQLGAAFEYEFPAASATVIRLPRKD